MPGGRPKRKDLPEGIGLYPDYVVSVIAQENGEAISTQGVRYLREVNDIPRHQSPTAVSGYLEEAVEGKTSSFLVPSILAETAVCSAN